METFIGIVVGGLITFVASWLFYRRASEDLRQEAALLRHYTDALAGLIEKATGKEMPRDEKGRPLAPVRKDLTLRGFGQRDSSAGDARNSSESRDREDQG